MIYQCSPTPAIWARSRSSAPAAAGILAICKGLVYSTMNQSPSDAKQGLQLALGMVGGKDVPERRNIIPH
jgi:hypothetical protein